MAIEQETDMNNKKKQKTTIGRTFQHGTLRSRRSQVTLTSCQATSDATNLSRFRLSLTKNSKLRVGSREATRVKAHLEVIILEPSVFSQFFSSLHVKKDRSLLRSSLLRPGSRIHFESQRTKGKWVIYTYF